MTNALTALSAQTLSLLRRSYFHRNASTIGVFEPSLISLLFWALLIFLLTNPFAFILTGVNPTDAVVRNLTTLHREGTSQTKLYLLRFGTPLIAFVIVIIKSKWRALERAIFNLAPIMPFIIWAMLSIGWSDEPSFTMRGVLTLLPLFLFPLLMVATLGPRYSARAMVYSAGIMGLASIFTVFVMPAYGVHQHADASQAVHAGLWRGVYLHKNHLGQVAGVYTAALLLANRAVIPSRFVRWGLLALMALLILKSGSASAVAIPVLAVGIVIIFVVLNPMQRMFAIIFSTMFAIIGFIALNLVMQALGRDMTFSGRDIIWRIALSSVSGHELTGYGFMSRFYGNFLYQLSRTMGVLDPHNALLDLLLAIGAVGVTLLLAGVLLSFVWARRSYIYGGANRAGALVFAGQTAAWLIAGITESVGRPMGAAATLGYMGLALLLVSRPQLVRGTRPAHVRPLGIMPREDRLST